jgi:hypothetical protein
MTTIKKTDNGIEYLFGVLKEKDRTVTRVRFWKIAHKTPREDICLKIGRYNKDDFWPETLEAGTPKSELTLDNEEFHELLDFLAENYEPFRQGARKYITLDEQFDELSTENLRSIFRHPDKKRVLQFIAKNQILPDDLLFGLQHLSRAKAIQEFENMLGANLLEPRWQEWFKRNDWVLGSEFVKVLDERQIDPQHITDYLMQAYDGFVDIIEIKRPEGSIRFWADTRDHDNYIPSSDLTKAIMQATRYIYEVEREANSVKFLERVGNVKTIKPRCVLIFGRSQDWNSDQREAYRILNASFHNLTIMTYDHVLARAKRMLGTSK